MSPEENQSPAMSVIVPAFNAAAYLRRCLEAVFASDGRSYECIVVDDGSTDDSAAIAGRAGARVVRISEGPFGPAHARNRGAEAARGKILFFLDADIVLAPGALRRVATLFQERTDVAAVFGSYDNCPAAPGVVSRYRNLLHHFVHQNGNREASTFWAGCGAIRRGVFEKIGGFDEQRFSRPSIEDIELGYRLRKAGYRILLDKQLQGTHLKRWSLYSMIRTDITCRAVPWSRLIREAPRASADLNLQPGQKASVALIGMAGAFLVMAMAWPQLLALSVLAIAGVVFLNRRLYAFFARQRGILFAAVCVPLHLLYYLYSGLSYLHVCGEFHISKLTRARPFSRVRSEVQPIKVEKT
jgi:glycosyltransferase involved in cell wall biosynthesis